MEIASRTPEGMPNRCPVCGNEVKIEPSMPVGDAPCPHCGTLLWFMLTDDGIRMFRALTIRRGSSASSAGASHTRRVEPWRQQEPVEPGDRVRITEGTFENFEGLVDHVDATAARVTVMINVFGRATPVELEAWQVERLT
jgi:hypothetical protein